MDVREVMSVTYAQSPSLESISVDGRDLRASIRQQSHIQLRELEYERAVELLLAAGAVEDGLYRAF